MAMILTTLGMLEESTLEKKPVRIQRPTGVEEATEWYKDGELVKRDARFTPNQVVPTRLT